MPLVGVRSAASAASSALLTLAVGLVAGCGAVHASDTGRSTDDASAGAARVRGSVTVFAAASLTATFTMLAKEFESANPGTTVTLNFAGSSTLAAQINQGAPVDVFASAALSNMNEVVSAGRIEGTPTVLARNQLVIAVGKGNPKRIQSLQDLTRPHMIVALCAEQVPCGAAARTVLAAAGVRLKPATFEPDVRSAMSKVRLGEADAALVYQTDVRTANAGVDGIEFPESARAVNEYPVAVCRDAPNRLGARAFLASLRSDHAKAVLASAGFQIP